MFSLLSSTLNAGLKSDSVGMINTKCKISFHREERGMGSGSSTVSLIYIFFLKLGNRVIGLHYIVVYTFLCA